MKTQCKESDLKVEVIRKEKEPEESVITNSFFNILIVLTIIGTGLIIQKIGESRNALLLLKEPSYKFPLYSDIYMAFIAVAILIIGKISIEKLSMPLVNLIVLQKYNDPTDEQNYELGKIYKKKIATNIFKIIFYVIMTCIGYSILIQVNYFPAELGGSGILKAMFAEGYPKSQLHWKPDYFDMYYMTGLGFCLTDCIWLLFIYELQSDFKMMLLHHLCTISLISFSYLTNMSNIGAIVLFIHDIGDVFVYFTRIIINIKVKSFWKIGAGLLLVVVFIYTRIFVLGQVLYTMARYAAWVWPIELYILFIFLCFLYLMHINWVYLIFKKIYSGMFENKIEDTSHVQVSKSK